MSIYNLQSFVSYDTGLLRYLLLVIIHALHVVLKLLGTYIICRADNYKFIFLAARVMDK